MAGFEPGPFLRRLTSQPGVYRMLDEGGQVLYVGKARNLKKRVSSYFLRASGNPRIEAMVDQIGAVEVTVTGSEDEALLLESSLIKSLKPRYNVQLRDDKSYPYLRFTAHAYPRIVFHRGAKQREERYFGPFPSAATVRETISTLQRVFLLRGCSDSYFSGRTRPCLQHQIRRCSAPCVGAISTEAYARSVQGAADVLNGRTDSLIRDLQQRMDAEAAALDFEAAAQSRDRIAAVRRMQEQRVVTGLDTDVDVIVLERMPALTGIGILSVRQGQHRGQVQHYPKVPADMDDAELIGEFLAQHYTSHPPPAELVLGVEPQDGEWLAHALAQSSGHAVRIKARVRGVRRQLRDLAGASLREAMKHRLLSRKSVGARMIALQERFGLSALPGRLECFDISHSGGEATTASCVVFDEEGAKKAHYRRFGIREVTAGDDYAAIAQAVRRRFSGSNAALPRPDVLLIDGGKGQLDAALGELAALGVDLPLVIGVAKGSSRKPGLEQLFLPGQREAVRLEDDDPALHLIQQVRDEAHRFAITGHRGRRAKARTRSELEEISGLGPARRQSLLRSFGGMRQLRRASLADIEKVPGINRALAQRVYDHLHEHE